MIRDLYQTLEVSPKASEEEVKRAYRRIAFLYHPDRNQAGAAAEDRCREANYAYSILGDKAKRKRYDLYREFMKRSARWRVPPSPAQERILTEVFLDPKFPGLGKWLEEVLRTKDQPGNGRTFWTLSKATLQFLREAYEYEKRRAPRQERPRRSILSYPKTILKKAGSTFRPFGTPWSGPGRTENGPGNGNADATHSGADIEWILPLTKEEANEGTRMTLSFFRDSEWDRISLLVPAGTRDGVRLRVRKKGNPIAASNETGDLYLRVVIR